MGALVTEAEGGLVGRYVAAQLRGDRAGALRLVMDEAIGQGWSVADVHLRLIQPAQYEIGARWQRNELSVAQEHLATAVTQLVVAQLYAHVERGPANGRTVLVACAPGESHELGARMAADFLEMAGFEVRFLGADVPADSLAAMVRTLGPDVVVLSAATSLCFPGLRAAFDAVRAADAAVPILVGGSAFDGSEAAALPPGVAPVGTDARALVTAVAHALAAA